MIKLFFNGLLKFILLPFQVMISPIGVMLDNLFPDMSEYITQFNFFIARYIAPTISYFSSILPPITRNVISLWLSFLVTYYVIVFSYNAFIRVFSLIRKIKFW